MIDCSRSNGWTETNQRKGRQIIARSAKQERGKVSIVSKEN